MVPAQKRIERPVRVKQVGHAVFPAVMGRGGSRESVERVNVYEIERRQGVAQSPRQRWRELIARRIRPSVEIVDKDAAVVEGPVERRVEPRVAVHIRRIDGYLVAAPRQLPAHRRTSHRISAITRCQAFHHLQNFHRVQPSSAIVGSRAALKAMLFGIKTRCKKASSGGGLPFLNVSPPDAPSGYGLHFQWTYVSSISLSTQDAYEIGRASCRERV